MSEEHEDRPVPRHLVLKMVLGHLAMFVIFHLTGMWAISTMSLGWTKAFYKYAELGKVCPDQKKQKGGLLWLSPRFNPSIYSGFSKGRPLTSVARPARVVHKKAKP